MSFSFARHTMGSAGVQLPLPDLQQQLFALNARTNAILPIILAAILPGLSLYSNNGWSLAESLGILKTWLIGALILYLLWYVLWFLWEIRTPMGKRRFAVALFLFLGLLAMTAYVAGLEVGGVRLHASARIVLAIILFAAIQYALKAQQNISRLQLEKEQIQTENYRVQLKALHTKIDPHFLFNSLNTLRSMVRQKHDNAEQFVISLSDFYRQTLKYNENSTLQLSEELSVLTSYLFLMKSRHGEAVSTHIQIDRDMYTYQLPTLALQVVVENCFKHNSMTSKMPLHISLTNTEDQYIVICNNIQPKLEVQHSSGFGLSLLRKRYELMNVKDGVIIEETPQQFHVKLKLI